MIKYIKIKEKRMNMEEIQDEKNLEKQRLKNALSDSLKELLKENDMKQKELAEKIGVSPTIVNAYYNAEKIPSVEIVYKIAEVFNVSMDWLYKRTENRDVSFKGIESMEFKTYSDVIKTIEKMKKVRIMETSLMGIGNFNNNYFRKVYVLLFQDEFMQNCLEKYKKIQDLSDSDLLDQDDLNYILNGKMKNEFNKTFNNQFHEDFKNLKNNKWVCEYEDLDFEDFRIQLTDYSDDLNLGITADDLPF